MKALLDKIQPLPIQTKRETPKFTKHTTDAERQPFHENHEDNMRKTYDPKEGDSKDGTKSYIGGTRETGDVLGWAKIPLGVFTNNVLFRKMVDLISKKTKT